MVLLHAIEPPPPIYGGLETIYPDTFDFEGLRGELEPRLLEFAGSQLPKTDISCEVELGLPAMAIVEYSEIHHVDLIAMPTHGYGPFRRALLGSVTAKVPHDSKIPVWTDAHCPEPFHRAHPQPRRIPAALDLKPETLQTLEAALQMARDCGAMVNIVHAAPEGEISPLSSEARLQGVLADAAREQLVKIQQLAGTEVDLVVDSGNVAQLVRSVALQKRSDLIVIGRGSIQGGISRLKANAYAIVREAPCPVLRV